MTKTAKAKKPSPPTASAAARSVRAPALPSGEAGAKLHGGLRLDEIRACPFNTRKRFDDADLAGLADSIRAIGLKDALLVRPVGADGAAVDLSDPDWRAKSEYFELVDGERRFRALALVNETHEVSTVPVIVQNLTDDQVRAIMLASREQSRDLAPSELVAGYADLRSRMADDAAVAAAVGKPLTYVRSVLRLARLPAWALAAVDKGTLPRATAELVARVPGEESRKRAAACVLLGLISPRDLGPDPDAWEAWCRGEKHKGTRIVVETATPLSYRDTRDLITNHFTKELKGAPFARKSLDLVPEAGACDPCPKRAANDADAVAEGTRGDVCLDPDCYREKVAAHDAVEIAKGVRNGAQRAPEEFVWPGSSDFPPRGWIDLHCPMGATELASELGPKRQNEIPFELLAITKTALDESPCPVFAALDSRHKLRLVSRTTDVRKALIAVSQLKKPQRVKTERSPSTNTGSKSGSAAVESPKSEPLISETGVLDGAAEIAAKVLGEMAAGDCGDIDAAAVAVRMIARFLIRDHCEFGPERRKHVAAALGFESGTAYSEKAFQARADELSPAGALGLCVRLVAGPVLEGEGGAGAGFAADLLAWGELDWDALKAQARRVLAGGESADAKIDSAEITLPVTDTETPQNSGDTVEPAAETLPDSATSAPLDLQAKPAAGVVLLSDIDGLPDAACDACFNKGITSLHILLAMVDAERPALAGLPLRNKLVTYFVSTCGLKLKPSEKAADAIAAHVREKGAA
jgi:ParB/RepB/Spo0J family partition protein